MGNENAKEPEQQLDYLEPEHLCSKVQIYSDVLKAYPGLSNKFVYTKTGGNIGYTCYCLKCFAERGDDEFSIKGG